MLTGLVTLQPAENDSYWSLSRGIREEFSLEIERLSSLARSVKDTCDPQILDLFFFLSSTLSSRSARCYSPHGPSFHLNPTLDCSESRPKSRKHCQQAPRQTAVRDTCSPGSPRSASFHSSSPFISLLLFYPTVSLFPPFAPWVNRSRTGEPPSPRSLVLNPSLPLCCCLLTLFQKPPSRVTTKRHLSREPKAQTTEGSLKEWSELDARQRKSQGEAARDDFKKSYPSIKFDTSMRHASKCKTYTTLGFADPYLPSLHLILQSMSPVRNTSIRKRFDSAKNVRRSFRSRHCQS